MPEHIHLLIGEPKIKQRVSLPMFEPGHLRVSYPAENRHVRSFAQARVPVPPGNLTRYPGVDAPFWRLNGKGGAPGGLAIQESGQNSVWKRRVVTVTGPRAWL